VRWDAAGCRLFVSGDPGDAICIQRSPDLKAWADWVILTGTGNPQEVVDPTAGSGASRFYRAVIP
jgi:hypothetical protein